MEAVTVWAETPGIIASSSGNPTVAPIPRRNVRRGNAFPVMNVMTLISFSSETAHSS